MTHPQSGVAAHARVARRTAESFDEEVPQTLFGADQVIGRIHGAEHIVVRDVPVENGHERADRVLTHRVHDEANGVLRSFHAATEAAGCEGRNAARRSATMTAPRPWHLLAPGQTPPRGAVTFPLIRRGVDHGTVVLGVVEPTPPADPDAAFDRDEPVLIPGVLGDALEDVDEQVAATWVAFDAFRAGARLLDDVASRLEDAAPFVYAGSSFDLEEPREIEKVFVDVPAADTSHGRRIRDLWAKLSWIADDESDTSMRIRMSFGHEATRDWLEQDVRAAWVDQLTARVFPESRIVTGNDVVHSFLSGVLAAPHRLGECIVYSNAPGGGAVFHHDADPGQRGVAFAQLLGVTVWLACPRTELALHAAAVARGVGAPAKFQEPDALAACFDADDDPALHELLNATPRLTQRLAEHGWLYVLMPGDVLLLPSHDPEHCAWHAVFGVGDAPSLGLSFGIFDAIPDLPGHPTPGIAAN